ncbi:MAG: LON peptidase substrate-binding domain-containing protein [Tepidisphaeraceae bacterium]
MGDPCEPDLSAVKLFPLPGVVLFPRAVLPLHIFEHRYRQMTADALRGDRHIAMALLQPGWEKSYYGRPALEPILCVGQILTHEILPDGKYNFLLQGVLRARLVREVETGDPYRVAEVQQLEEAPASEDQLREQRERLSALFLSSSLGMIAAGQQFGRIVESDLPTAGVADLAAFTFLESTSLKQSLLAEPDVGLRVRRTVEALERVAAELPQMMRVAAPPDPSVN